MTEPASRNEPEYKNKTWRHKFAVALNGIAWATRNQSSFRIHLPIAVAALAIAVVLQVETWRIVSVIVSITLVLAAELVNTSIEQIVRVLHPQYDERVKHALDAAAGAVLITAIGAVIIGLSVLGRPLWNAVIG